MFGNDCSGKNGVKKVNPFLRLKKNLLEHFEENVGDKRRVGHKQGEKNKNQKQKEPVEEVGNRIFLPVRMSVCDILKKDK